MDNRFKQYEVLKWASLFLERYNREPKVAELLLQYHLGIDRAGFFASMQEPIDHQLLLLFEEDLMNHALTGIPIQHLSGYETFYGRRFKVNEHVLIPRPETEELIEKVITYVKKRYSSDEPLTIVDIGTGSGIIAITLALEMEHVNMYATDISEEALQIAKLNAIQHDADVEFLQGNFMQPVINKHIKTDIIVSNPPYISADEKPLLSDTVKDFDPSLALFADDNGLAAYKAIVRQLTDYVKHTDDLSIFFEIGQHQGPSVKRIFENAFPESQSEVYKDINQKERIVHCHVSNNHINT